MVPQKANLQLQNSYLPIDFSEHSEMAMEAAVDLLKKEDERTIYCHHVYFLPSGFYTTGKSEAEFSAIMRHHAEERMKGLLARFNKGRIPVKTFYERSNPSHAAKAINRKAHHLNADLRIIGARGRTRTAALLLGSTTEHLIRMDSDIPILIVKSKEKVFDFFELIKTI